MVTMDLFDFAKARARDPQTSKLAAASVDVTPMEAHVVGALKAYPDGLTTHEISEITRMSLVTVSPRMKPLAEKGYVVDSGTTRLGENNRKRIVWKLRKRS